jgi:hypothetical protein
MLDRGPLHNVGATSRVNRGVALTPNFLEDGNELEDSENRRSVGGHGNQYVRLRGASLRSQHQHRPGSIRECGVEPGQTIKITIKILGASAKLAIRKILR